MEKKEFKTITVISLITSIVLCEPHELKAAINFLLGKNLNNYEFNRQQNIKKLRERTSRQHPDLPTRISGINLENSFQIIEKLEKTYSTVRTLIPVSEFKLEAKNIFRF